MAKKWGIGLCLTFLSTLSWAQNGISSSQLGQTRELPQAESLLLEALTSLKNFEFDQAEIQLQALTRQYPNYALAQLLQGDLYAIRAGQLSQLQRLHRLAKVKSLLAEARVRWQHAQQPVSSEALFQHYVFKLPTSQNPYFILVNLAKNRLYLYHNKAGQVTLLEDFYVTMGQKGFGKERDGDRRTPLGIYQITQWIPDEKLPDLYGAGALTLNYPNAWDRRLGRTGSGIWLHGTPSNTFVRAPQASRGCVVMANKAVHELVDKYRLPSQTPVILAAEQVPAFEREQRDEQKLAVLQNIQYWLRNQLANQVDWSTVAVYRYPNEKNLFYVQFTLKNQAQPVIQFWRYRPEGGQLVYQQPEKIPFQSKTHAQLAMTP